MTVVPELEFKEMLDKLNFKQPRRSVVLEPRDYEGRFPAVLKVSSANITHKTEIGAVVSDIKSMEELEVTLGIMKSKFPGEVLYVEEMAKKGIEVIIGLVNDNQFGKLLMFGVGGYYSELIKDVTFKRVPIDRFDAEDVITELKYGNLLDGYRGLKSDRRVLVDLLLKVSDFAENLDFSQVDFNPVFLYEDDYLIIDAKMVI